MKSILRNTCVLSSALFVAIAGAQIYSHDPDLQPFLTTDQLRAQLYDSGIQIAAAGRAVGFDGGDYANLFGLANAAARARTHFNEFVVRRAIGAGQAFQIGVHAFALDRAGSGPVRVWVSIFQRNALTPNVVPLGAPVLTDLPIDIPASSAFDVPASVLVYSQRIPMPNAMAPGRYVLAISPSANPGAMQPANFALVMTRNANLGVVEAADRGIFRMEYGTLTNNAENGGSVVPPDGESAPLSQPIAYRIYSRLKTGDANGDGAVDIDDYLILAAAYETSVGDPRFDARADFNGDGSVDIDDYLILAANYEG